MRGRQKYRSHPMSRRQKSRRNPKKTGWTRFWKKFWRSDRTKPTAAAAATGSRSRKASARPGTYNTP